MNNIRQIQELNKRELENGVSPEASWHADYRDTAYVYIGGLPFELSEGDIITIFSQFGEPTYINLIRDKDTGRSKGFAFLKYEDQRSTDLAVDNLGGTTILNRTIRVDHTRYKKKDEEVQQDDELGVISNRAKIVEGRRGQKGSQAEDNDSKPQRPLLTQERELSALIENHDDDDPMKSFLIQEKKAEISEAYAQLKNGKTPDTSHRKRHQHPHSHQSGRTERRNSKQHSRRHRSEHRRSRSKE